MDSEFLDDATDLQSIAEETKSLGAVAEKELTPLVKVIPDEIFSWLSGEASEPPSEIKRLGENVTNKMTWFVVYTTLSQFARLPTLYNYTAQAEKILFNPEDLHTLDSDTLLKRYELARKTMGDVLEFSRKFTVQNKDLLGSGVSEEDQVLLSRIKQLNRSQLEKLQVLIDQSESESTFGETLK